VGLILGYTTERVGCELPLLLLPVPGHVKWPAVRRVVSDAPSLIHPQNLLRDDRWNLAVAMKDEFLIWHCYRITFHGRTLWPSATSNALSLGRPRM
jgi:hypothetical protein